MKCVRYRWFLQLHRFKQISLLGNQSVHINKCVHFLPTDIAWHSENQLIKLVPAETNLFPILRLYCIDNCFSELLLTELVLSWVAESEYECGWRVVELFEEIGRADFFHLAFLHQTDSLTDHLRFLHILACHYDYFVLLCFDNPLPYLPLVHYIKASRWLIQ